MRLIDADELRSEFGVSDSDIIAKETIDDAPTIDAVPVVRCRECRKWDADPDSYGKDDGPKGKCMKSFEETYDNDFCSYGQRKIETVLPKSDAKDESLEAGHD